MINDVAADSAGNDKSSSRSVHRNITYRLLPVTRTRAKQLNRLAGACRFVWNHFLGQRLAMHRFNQCFEATHGIKPTSSSCSFFTFGKEFTQLRKQATWLCELAYAPVRYELKYLADAWKRFFNDITGNVGKPKFRRRHDEADGFTIPGNIKIDRHGLHIPRIGCCKLRRKGGNPYPDGKAKQARVLKRCGKWYAVVTYEVDLPERVDDGKVIGVDMNVGQVATSTGHVLTQPEEKRLLVRRRRYQRMMSRRERGSRRYRRAKRKHAKTTSKLANRRNDWRHKTSKRIADSAHTVVVEDLNTKGMTRSAKGSVESPGTKVKAKSGLNKGIQNTGWTQMRLMLEYKAGALIKVNPRYTSQTCHACGHVDKRNRRTQAHFKCVQCGHESNADVNAALNMASGIGASGRVRAATLVGPMIRQIEP